ncbi:hypothetical protein BB558_002278 [Smittium angustum]|uniref:Uncharacterized protein n=1 Tax=Smittium angustum TaxID=133377 RepID=A0A2U1J9C5_SMIAN|nr:hypothetical protein BB558_002278 [Smittium angustum]
MFQPHNLEGELLLCDFLINLFLTSVLQHFNHLIDYHSPDQQTQTLPNKNSQATKTPIKSLKISNTLDKAQGPEANISFSNSSISLLPQNTILEKKISKLYSIITELLEKTEYRENAENYRIRIRVFKFLVLAFPDLLLIDEPSPEETPQTPIVKYNYTLFCLKEIIDIVWLEFLRKNNSDYNSTKSKLLTLLLEFQTYLTIKNVYSHSLQNSDPSFKPKSEDFDKSHTNSQTFDSLDQSTLNTQSESITNNINSDTKLILSLFSKSSPIRSEKGSFWVSSNELENYDFQVLNRYNYVTELNNNCGDNIKNVYQNLQQKYPITNLISNLTFLLNMILELVPEPTILNFAAIRNSNYISDYLFQFPDSLFKDDLSSMNSDMCSSFGLSIDGQQNDPFSTGSIKDGSSFNSTKLASTPPAQTGTHANKKVLYSAKYVRNYEAGDVTGGGRFHRQRDIHSSSFSSDSFSGSPTIASAQHIERSEDILDRSKTQENQFYMENTFPITPNVDSVNFNHFRNNIPETSSPTLNRKNKNVENGMDSDILNTESNTPKNQIGDNANVLVQTAKRYISSTTEGDVEGGGRKHRVKTRKSIS